MQDEKSQTPDDIRCDAALQTIKDILFRFDETSEGSYTLYDLVGFLVEDLVKEMIANTGENIAIRRFERWEVGEDIEG